ncbi:MAG: hypothetical protein JXK07_14525 [Spirochaetes bacterium]|nr:hypothetical protein [Spirochaetota bacterium]MBN2770209.1 hypothetical protein [Spirochaetota bacterium]
MELTVGSLVQNSIKKGIKYVGPLVVNVLLYFITFLVPYLNVGTTIGLWFGIPAKMARDEEISFTEIFDAKYRKNMGEIFLTMGLVYMGVLAGFIFMIIPGYVIMIAWMLALILVADKEYTPLDAIKKSNNITYGKKWTIFFGMIVLQVVVWIVVGILVTIFSKISAALGGLVMVACMLFATSIGLGFMGELYGTLAKDA